MAAKMWGQLVIYQCIFVPLKATDLENKTLWTHRGSYGKYKSRDKVWIDQVESTNLRCDRGISSPRTKSTTTEIVTESSF